uniref:Uncharacterized protein n=1 Tax=Arundo donax TaxID=35708 RepID=A0A0A9BFL2_ARUDO
MRFLNLPFKYNRQHLFCSIERSPLSKNTTERITLRKIPPKAANVSILITPRTAAVAA